MKRELRVAGGAIIINENKILLLRYRGVGKTTYLVGPGGRVEENEGIEDAIRREVQEETSLVIEPYKVLAIEDLRDKSQRMIKIWMISKQVQGIAKITHLGEAEGIIDLGWYSKDQLGNEVVYPEFIKSNELSKLRSKDWKVICYPPRIIEE